jgi:hypothetical protein
MIDPEIFEGEFDQAMMLVFVGIYNQNTIYSESLLQYRPTWLDELHDIDLILNGKDADRVKDLKVIEDVSQYASFHSSAFNFEWSLNPDAALHLLGWDEERVMKEVTAELLAQETKSQTQFGKFPKPKNPSAQNFVNHNITYPGTTTTPKPGQKPIQ